MTPILPGITQGTLLDGKVVYAQPRTGYRTGIEPVLLAASVPARRGDRVLEAGCGAGAGLLCLLWRVPGLLAHGIEVEPGMADIARRNLAANALPAMIHTADVARAASLGPFDHAFANPPWHDPTGTVPPDERRAMATHGAGLAAWVAALTEAVRGTLTLAVPAAQVGKACGLLCNAGFGAAVVVPLWPKPGLPARIALIQARHGAGPARHGAGMVLHRDAGAFTAEVEAVLRLGAPLDVS